MLPINDNINSRRKPWVTYALIAVNVVVFLMQLVLTHRQINQQFRLYGFTPALLFNRVGGAIVWSLVTLITSQFLHGGWSHILGNMLYLWVFGDNIEDELGHLPFLILYLGSGVFGSLVHGFTTPVSFTPLVGASGAIAGLLGAYFILFPGAKIRSLVPILFFFFTVNVPALFYLGAWFLLQLLNGSMASGADTVAYMAHVGGFAIGAIVALWWKKRRRRRWELIEADDNDWHQYQQ